MSSGFLLDTNVISELMRGHPDAAVLAWFARNRRSVMSVSAVTQAEVLTGIALLLAGKRRTALAMAAEKMFEQDFAGQCLAFASAEAKHYALIVADRTRRGLPISTEDAQIAAIALTAGLTVATRNTKDFENIDGLTLANPWQSA